MSTGNKRSTQTNNQTPHHMTAEKYTTRAGEERFRPAMTESEFAAASDDGVGFCLACGEEADCCEPDARKYECACCGEEKVYGLAELLMMGLVRFTD